MAMPTVERVAAGIEQDPNHPGPGEVRLAISWVPVWAIIGHFRATGGTASEVASDYGIDLSEVETALVYYGIFSSDIDARLRANGQDSLTHSLTTS